MSIKPYESSPQATQEAYLIGPADVLEIRVLDRPQLSLAETRVDGRGMIRLPFIEDVQAACRTENDLARDIAARYLKYQTDPQVSVFVKQYNSQPVAIIGAVNTPGRFQLQRRIRLLELLTYAGGPSNVAGRNIQLVHTAPAISCGAADTQVDQNIYSYNLNAAMRGDAEANPYIQPGDIISLPEAEQIFVVGNVYRPATIPLKEPITASRAIAMAGGFGPDAQTDKVRVFRAVPGRATNTEIIVDLRAVQKRQAEDIVLQAGDIVDVPTSGGKRFVRGLVSAIAPAAVQTPVRIIR